MSTLNAGNTGRGNLLDLQKIKAPNSTGALQITNTLVETNDLMKDLESLPSNGGLTHHGVRVSSLPSGSFVDIGGTWGHTKSERTPFVEGMATVRDSYECPLDVLKTLGEAVSKAHIADERDNHVIGNSQAWGNVILRGPTTPTQDAIVGLLERPPWNAIDGEFTYDVGGDGSYLRHALLVCPGPSRVHLIHNPVHPTLGIEFEDKTGPNGVYKVDQLDTTKHNYWLVHEFMIQQGICIADQRAFKVLANIPCASTDYAGPELVNMAIRASLKHNILSNRPWFLYLDVEAYTQVVLSTNDILKVHTSNKNIYQTDLPMIGPNIIIRRLDALKPLSGTGETQIE